MATVSGGPAYVPLNERPITDTQRGFNQDTSTSTWQTLLDISGSGASIDYLESANTGSRKYRITVDGNVLEDSTSVGTAGVRIGADADLASFGTVDMILSKNPIVATSSLKLEYQRSSGTVQTRYLYRTFD